MKKSIFTLFGLLLAFGLHAQTGVIAVARPTGLPPEGDTIFPMQFICLDSTITSFTVSVFKGGVGMEKRSNGNCCMLPFMPQSGSKVYISEIVSYPKPGVKVRLPDRQYYVR